MSGLSGFMLSCIILNCDILYTDVIHSPCKHNNMSYAQSKMSYAQTLHGSIFSRVKITSSGIVNSVHQAAPPKSSCAPIPQGATSFLWLQRHGLKNHGLKSGTSGPKRGLLERQSWQAGPSPSPPCRTSTSCQPWLLASGES